MADWKSIVKSIAPTLGTLLGGPLVGTAVKVLGDKLLGNPDATQDEVQKAIESGLPPETVIKLAEIDAQVKTQMQAANLDLKKLDAQREQTYIGDTQDARKANAQNNRVFWLGVIILSTFALVMGVVFWLSYSMLGGHMSIKTIDPGVVAAVFSLIGAVVGYAAANAQQVVGFFFGSSMGSGKKSDDMADAVKALAGGPK